MQFWRIGETMNIRKIFQVIAIILLALNYGSAETLAAGTCPDDGSIPIPTTPAAGINPLPPSCEVGNEGHWEMDPGYINYYPLGTRTYYVIGIKRYEYWIGCYNQAEGRFTCTWNGWESGLPALADPDPDDICLNGCAEGYNYCHLYRGSWTWVCS